MKFDASSRHSEGYFLEAKPTSFVSVASFIVAGYQFTHHNRNTAEGKSTRRGNRGDQIDTPNQTKTFKKPCIFGDKLVE